MLGRSDEYSPCSGPGNGDRKPVAMEDGEALVSVPRAQDMPDACSLGI